MREKEIEALLRDGVKRLGGIAYKFTSPGNSGVPDRLVVFRGRAPIFVELKTKAGRLTELQEVQIERLRSLGQDVRVLYGKDDVLKFLSLQETLQKIMDELLGGGDGAI
ncbi:VRR-NUC domain protein [Eubacterium sp. An11]|uniref:VRR-NUC domain-containing protein n=1 Tax=Eubacterium sp. An11 TaxID=1965542 RepID=UPI000B39E64E|nr:VRR-NUC domain-containing protein [Eubacterium sp. An11]OUQ69601.1 VRR-NUC domain protein [Eubacterium sp. An11]